mmetsp:Transcript_23062/g.63691  ORF Transcript_23062/g.63691 Transcript_23062/m.63691 type:complete len:998 (+) Transcript_23062:198-3191(+)
MASFSDELEALRKQGSACASPAHSKREMLQHLKEVANANTLAQYKSPLALFRLVTQLQWQQPSDIPPQFLEDLTSNTSFSNFLSQRGWCLHGVAVREESPGELVLELLTCACGPEASEPGGEANGPANDSSKKPNPSEENQPAAGPNIILKTCTTPGAVSAYRHLLEEATASQSETTEPCFNPSMFMTWLHLTSQARARVGMQVLLQEESDLYLMQHAPPPASEDGTSPTSDTCTPCWTQTRLDPSIPMPGLLNLSTPPSLVGVAPRCVASNGLSSVKLSVYGMYIQGGKMTARCGGRFLQTTWRMHESVRVTSRAQFARWHRFRANEKGTEEEEEPLELNVEMEAELVIYDPPSCGLVAVECRQGYLVSKPAYLLVVPATQNMARELTSGLACPPPPPQLISRSNTQTQIAMDSEEDEDQKQKTRDDEAKERILRHARSREKAKHLEAVKDSIARDLGSWLQYVQLTRRQLGNEYRPPIGNPLLPVWGSSSNMPSRSSFSTNLNGGQDRPSRLVYQRSSGRTSHQGSQDGTSSQNGGKRASMIGLSLPSINGREAASTDLTLQLISSAVKNHVHKANMVSLGVRLLQLACELAWPATARTILTGLMDLGLNLQEIEAKAFQDGFTFLHRAVRSRNAGMVAEVAAWASAAKRDIDWGAADHNGVTPLHLAACLQDGGLLAIHILRKWPAAGQLWLTKETFKEKLTPKHVAEGAGNDFLNRMADMAGLLACQSCTEMACAMRTALPGQLLSGPTIGDPGTDGGTDGNKPDTLDNKDNSSNATKQAAQGDQAIGEATNGSTPAQQPSGTGDEPGTWAMPRAASSLPVVPEFASSNEASGSAEGASRAGSAAAGAVERATRKVSGGAWDMRVAAQTTGSTPSDTKGGLASVWNNSNSPLRTSPRSSPPAVSSSSVPSATQQAPSSQHPNEYLVGGAASLHGQQHQPHKPGAAQQSETFDKDLSCVHDAASNHQQGNAPPPSEPDSPPPRVRKKRGLCGLF